MTRPVATLSVGSPVAGTVRELTDVPDPVFAGAIVGPGLALDPGGAEASEVLAPIRGRIVKLHPHAFVLLGEEGRGVLVHLGIDTVQLEGEGFTLHAAEGDEVEAGQLLVTWSPRAVIAGGRSAITPVVALEGSADDIATVVATGAEVSAGDSLFTWQ